MKRVCNDNKLQPEKAKNRYKKFYYHREILPKNHESYTKSTKFSDSEVKNI